MSCFFTGTSGDRKDRLKSVGVFGPTGFDLKFKNGILTKILTKHPKYILNLKWLKVEKESQNVKKSSI
jgi:hypothetical protein